MDDEMDFVYVDSVIDQLEQDMAGWCPSSGEDVGRMIPMFGSDDWKTQCPTCGTTWYGGGPQLPDHQRTR